MNVQLYQLWGMVRYEFKMHWRRRALKVVILALAVLIGVMVLLQNTDEIKETVIDPAVENGTLTRPELNTYFAIFSSWFVSAATIGFILPVALADTIPLDKQMHTHELLDSLPLPRSIYLAGKVLGSWAAILPGIVGIMVVSSVAWWLLIGNYYVHRYIAMWLLGVGVFVILNTGLGILLPATQPSRRRALLLMIFVIFILPNFFGLNFTPGDKADWWDYSNTMRLPLFFYYATIDHQKALQDALIVSAIGVLELALVWVGVWGWYRWQEQH